MFSRFTNTRSSVFRALVMTLLVSLGGCAGTSDVDAPAADTLEHIHGLGINPADGSLYAATHHGVFRIGRRAELVGPRQDTMGFTVAGPDRFLASGHPSTLDQPNPLGLIESRDRAESWTPLAFSGQADFHALDVSNPWTYAYSADRGELMRTRDYDEWTSVVTAGLLDIAVDPSDPDRVLLTSEAGRLMSLKVGREASPITGSPTMGPIDFAADDIAVGLGSSGEVYVSSDDADSWTRSADLPGTSQAVVADPGRWFAATTEGIFVSDDGGTTWEPYYPREP